MQQAMTIQPNIFVVQFFIHISERAQARAKNDIFALTMFSHIKTA
jgi:hypothetical protein